MAPRGAALPPDHLRCRRNDGRGWRCVRPAMDNSSFCRLHFLQYRLRQSKQPVPRSMKLRRGSSSPTTAPATGSVGAASPAEAKPPRVVFGKFKLKKDAALWVQLVSMDLRRRIEKEQRRCLSGGRKRKFLVRDLPNGTMSISPRSEPFPPIADDDDGLACTPKIGLDDNLFFHRCFRSKNVEPVPLSGFRIVACSRDSRQKCHQCRKASFNSRLRCFKCQEELYCKSCYQQFYSKISVENFKACCPRCRGCCSCMSCLDCEPKEAGSKELLRDQEAVDKIFNAHYVICLLLPILKQLNRDQKAEFDIETRLLGSCPSSKQLQQAKCDANPHCNHCMALIVDMHRSCSSCSFNLCIKCCQEIRMGNSLSGIRLGSSNGYNKLKVYKRCLKSHSEASGMSSRIKWETNEDNETITCPSKELGGCGTNILELRCVFPLNWIQDLEMVAEEIACLYDIPTLLDKASCCSLCPKNHHKDALMDGNLREASRRVDSDDNFLYSPSQKGIRVDGIEHFQQHWIRGHPIIVRDITEHSSELSWDPLTLFQSLLQKDESKLGNDAKTKDVDTEKNFNGCSRGRRHHMLYPKILKILEWPPLSLLRDQLPKHYAELIRVLPFQEYTNPDSASLNLAMKLPTESFKNEHEPYMHIFYGSNERNGHNSSTTNLSIEISDMVNVLMHASELPTAGRQIGGIEKKKRRLLTKLEKKCLGMSLMQQMSTDDIKKEHLTHEVIKRQNISREEPENEASDITFERQDLTSVENCKNTHKEKVEDMPDQQEVQRLNHFDDEVVNKSPGVQWDVFRREDVSKLITYLDKHFNKSRLPYYSSDKCIAHPLHDRCFFLDTAHKRKLKKEFQVEPWTFVQHVGEAVIVPAGCPYQLKNLKCCVKVGMDFISPESGWKCIQLIDELRLLPASHKARRNDTEINKMILFSINAAVEEIQKSTSSGMLSRQ